MKNGLQLLDVNKNVVHYDSSSVMKTSLELDSQFTVCSLPIVFSYDSQVEQSPSRLSLDNIEADRKKLYYLIQSVKSAV